MPRDPDVRPYLVGWRALLARAELRAVAVEELPLAWKQPAITRRAPVVERQQRPPRPHRRTA